MSKDAPKPDGAQRMLATLVRTLDADIEDFEDLLDLFETQNEQLTAQIQSLSRQMADLQSEFVELRETLELVVERLDRRGAPVPSPIDNGRSV